MAGNFALNTAQTPSLSQVLMAMPSGIVYDHTVRQSAGKVTLAAAGDQAVARAQVFATHPLFVET